MGDRSVISEASAEALRRDLRAAVGDAAVLGFVPPEYEVDATEGRGIRGRADAVVLPASTDEAAKAMAWCYSHDVPMTPRGGGTGFAGGAVPIDGGVVIGMERMNSVRSLDAGQWRISVDAGMTTEAVRSAASAVGLMYPPDPGAGEWSQIGGNAATNAGGPHTFKYGSTGAWVTGIEVVVAPGEAITFGGPVRKDVAGLDLRSLLVGSEGTLGLITGLWLRLRPRPAGRLPVVVVHPNIEAGCDAIAQVLSERLMPATLEFLDPRCVEVAAEGFPFGLPEEGGFVTIAEADGSAAESTALRARLIEVLGAGSVATHAPLHGAGVAAIWDWRRGVSNRVSALRGGKASEDIAVPVEFLREAIEGTLRIGEDNRLEALSWGHAGDGNLHSTLLVGASDERGQARASIASDELHQMAIRLGGTVSGEHGLGWVRRSALERQWDPKAVELHRSIKDAFDPKGLINPGKKGYVPRS